MKQSSLAVFNSFLDRLPPPRKEKLLNCLRKTEKSLLGTCVKTKGNPSLGFSSCEDNLARIHYSWFAPYLRTLPEKDIRLFLTALPDEHSSGLKKLLLLSDGLIMLPKSTKAFLQKTLLNEILGAKSDILPLECLPETPLNALLELKSSDLSQLIFFLGLHDLALDMKHIIETAKLKKIQSLLLPSHQNYLKILFQSREPVVFAKMGLAKWTGDEESLKGLIYQRGFNRLAKACFGQDPSFLWYLTHTLEIDQAHLFQKLCTHLDNMTALQALHSQVLEILSFMRRTHE